MSDTTGDLTGHRCAAIGCQRTVQPGYLMCIDHWRMVPAQLQRDVWTSWREVRRQAFRSTSADKAQVLARYHQAAKAAIDAVHAKALARKAKHDAGTNPLF